MQKETQLLRNIFERIKKFKNWKLKVEISNEERDKDKSIALKIGDRTLLISGFKESEKNVINEIIEIIYEAERFKMEKYTDTMTGLFNKEYFMQKMKENIEKLRQELLNKEKKEHRKSFDLSMLHIDLDHFKRINDTWGHSIGDAVLKSFACYIENFSLSYFKEDTEVITARLGGEEFGILLPNTPGTIARSFAETLLENLKSKSIVKKEKDIPSISVTASIGVATLKSAECLSGNFNADALASKLYNDADVATYVAKKLGRARVIAYERIKYEGGTVIDYDETTEIVVIDIGSDMGVNVGDIFKVYDNKKFTGESPIYEPGSKEKIIGYYPKIPLGEIEVIMVQPGVSFAKRIGTEPFTVKPGFVLEYSTRERDKTSVERRKRERRAKGFISERGIFEKRLAEVSSQESFIVSIMAMDNFRIITDRLGSARVEKLYKKVIKDIDSFLPEGSIMARLSNEEIGIIPSHMEDKEIKRIFEGIIEELKNQENIGFSAGIYSALKWEKGRKYALECARKALEIARFEGGAKVVIFDEKNATKKLEFYIKHRDYEHILEEYNSLIKLGLSVKGLRSVYAEALYYFGKLEEALKENLTALKESPNNPEILKNIAYTYLELGRAEEALRYFKKLEENNQLYEIAKDAPWIFRDYGIVLYNLGKYREAEKKLTEAVQLENTDAMSYYYRAMCRVKEKEIEKAKEDLIKAVGLGYKELSEEASKILGG